MPAVPNYKSADLSAPFWTAKRMAIAAVLTIAALVVRFYFLPALTGDYYWFINPWVQYLKSHGGFAGLATLDSNYAAPYLYVLAAISYLPWEALAPVKIFSFVFDFAMAATAGMLAKEVSGDRSKALVAYGLVLLAPTAVMNSAIWAQCDSLWTSLLLCMLLAVIRNQPVKAMAFLGAALAIKLQAVFLLPFVVYMLLAKKLTITSLLAAPASFLLLNIPGFLLGIPISRMWSVYITQTTYYPDANTMNAPNIYALLGGANGNALPRWVGLVLMFALLGVVMLRLFNKDTKISKRTAVLLFLFSALAPPCLLPSMHERYFFAAEMASLVWVALMLWDAPLALLLIGPACLTYSFFLFSWNPVPLQILAVFPLMALVWVIARIWRFIKEDRRGYYLDG